ncbi:geranylgeranyl reductase family protein [bacterium]|nr:geranylgeranyl reductase family protein [bacterium]
MPDKTYDLIIVGGGPAGATAALYAGRQGLKTLLLEKARFPRDKVCGDALSGKAVTVLRELGLLEKVRGLPGASIRSVTFGSPDHTEANVVFSRSGRQDFLTGFVIRRQVFDHFLFEEARRAADACVEGFAVRDLVGEDGPDGGVRGMGRDGEVVYRGRVVLGADGFGSVVARRAGLYRHEPGHWVVALRCYYQNVGGLTDRIELHFIDEVLPGYFWIFPMENGCANVGIGMRHDYLKRRGVDLKAALQAATRSPHFRGRFAGAKALEEPVGWNLPLGSKRRKISGGGFMLLGDAAGLIDPFTGEGIGNAMYSARLAVETAREARAAGDFGEASLTGYEGRVWDALGEELRVSFQMQQLGRLRFLLNFVIRKAARNRENSDLICGMIANEVPKQRLMNPLFYLKLMLA